MLSCNCKGATASTQYTSLCFPTDFLVRFPRVFLTFPSVVCNFVAALARFELSQSWFMFVVISTYHQLCFLSIVTVWNQHEFSSRYEFHHGFVWQGVDLKLRPSWANVLNLCTTATELDVVASHDPKMTEWGILLCMHRYLDTMGHCLRISSI